MPCAVTLKPTIWLVLDPDVSAWAAPPKPSAATAATNTPAPRCTDRSSARLSMKIPPMSLPPNGSTAEIGGHQPALSHILRLAHVDDPALVHHIHVVRQLQCGVDVLLDQQQAGAADGPLPERVEELLDDARRQPHGDLVHHEELRLREQGPGQRQHLLLATRQGDRKSTR